MIDYIEIQHYTVLQKCHTQGGGVAKVQQFCGLDRPPSVSLMLTQIFRSGDF